ncbi:MAG: hypothetical protein ACI8TQ_003436 [Planctomycetota bacterium]|jgi:hypothetical protein
MKSILPLLALLAFETGLEAQFSSAPFLPGQRVQIPKPQSIGNGLTRLGLTVTESLGLVPRYLGDEQAKQAISLAAKSLWRLELLDLAGTSTADVVAVDASDCTFDMFVAKSDQSFRAYWRNIEFTHPGLPAGSSGEVMVFGRIGPDGRTFLFDLEVETNVPGFSLYATALNVGFNEYGNSSDQVFAVPRAGGTLMPAPLDSISLLQAAFSQDEYRLGEQPGVLSMQWVAYYNSADANSPVAYFGTRDGIGHGKVLFTNVDTSVAPRVFETRVYSHPENNSLVTSHKTPFPYVLGALRGNWYDAAAYYREWGLAQSWAAHGSLLDNPEASSILTDSKMYGLYTVPRCEPPTVTMGALPCIDIPDTLGVSDWADLVDEIETFFELDKVAGTATTFWDHNSHFNANWGEWLPVTSEMITAAPQMAAAGNDFALYYAPNIYSVTGPSYDVAAPADPNTVPSFSTQPVKDFALRDPFGAITLASPNSSSCDKNLGCSTPQDSFSRQTAMVCTQTEFYPQLALHIFSNAILSTGAKGFFLDNFTSGGSPLCYDPGHGHPLGSTKGWIQAKFDYCKRLKEYFRGLTSENGQFFASPDPDFYLTSEGEQEMYLGMINLTRRTRSGPTQDLAPGIPFRRSAPLYQAVYHGRQLAFDGRLAFSGPIDLSIHLSSFGLRFVRQQWAANVYFGHMPVSSLRMGELGAGSGIVEKAAMFPLFQEFVDAMKNWMVVLREDESRRFLLFGERLRDPVMVGVDTVELEASGSGTVFAAFWPGVDAEQSFVYANAHSDDDEVGLSFVNWTLATDDTTSIPALDVSDSPGDQTFTYMVDPVDYGMAAGMYEMVEVLGDGLPDAVLGTADFSALTPQSFPLTVPGGTMRFIIFRPM